LPCGEEREDNLETWGEKSVSIAMIGKVARVWWMQVVTTGGPGKIVE
jgi:hypothetical protein